MAADCFEIRAPVTVRPFTVSGPVALRPFVAGAAVALVPFLALQPVTVALCRELVESPLWPGLWS